MNILRHILFVQIFFAIYLCLNFYGKAHIAVQHRALAITYINNIKEKTIETNETILKEDILGINALDFIKNTIKSNSKNADYGFLFCFVFVVLSIIEYILVVKFQNKIKTT